MMQLILYANITEDPFTMLPQQLLELQNDHVRVFDFDTRSGKEVIHTVLTAMEQATSIVLVLDVTSENEECSALFPVLKRAVRLKGHTKVIRLGSHPQLSFIQNQLTPVVLMNHEKLFKYLNEISSR